MGIFSKKSEEKKDAATQAVDTKAVPKTAAKKDKGAMPVVTATASAYGVLVAPIVTEKSHQLSGNRQYVFRVATTATARTVKIAVAQAYHVTVTAVRIMTVKPKRRTMKYDRGYQKQYKKAIVTLAKGQSIDLFHAA